MLEAKAVTKQYRSRAGVGGEPLVVVRDVSVLLRPEETTGLVGESGSGKSTLGRLLAGLERPDGGEVWFEGCPLTGADGEIRKRFRRSVQVIFQNPMNALNPRWTVRAILEEPFRIHAAGVGGSLAAETGRILDEVRLPQAFLSRRPHELSGGERQRVCIARALALKPRIVICDESVSSLDVLVRAQILNLLLELQRTHRIGYLFISHDLAVVRHMSDRLLVMKDGRVVESGPAADVLAAPQTEYARSLIDAGKLEFRP